MKVMKCMTNISLGLNKMVSPTCEKKKLNFRRIQIDFLNFQDESFPFVAYSIRIYWWCSIGFYSNPNIASFAGEISNCSIAGYPFHQPKKVLQKTKTIQFQAIWCFSPSRENQT